MNFGETSLKSNSCAQMSFWIEFLHNGVALLRPTTGELFDYVFYTSLIAFYKLVEFPRTHIINGEFRKITICAKEAYKLIRMHKHIDLIPYKRTFIWLDVKLSAKPLIFGRSIDEQERINNSRICYM